MIEVTSAQRGLVMRAWTQQPVATKSCKSNRAYAMAWVDMQHFPSVNGLHPAI